MKFSVYIFPSFLIFWELQLICLERLLQYLFVNSEEIVVTIWDFAGQTVYYAVHHLFLTDNGIAVLCFNMKKLEQQQGLELQMLQFWVQSMSLHAKKAPLVIVGTHCEDVPAHLLVFSLSSSLPTSIASLTTVLF